MSAPRRGEVWWVDLGLAAKIRPWAVPSVSAVDDNQVTLMFNSSMSRNFTIGLRVEFGAPWL